MRRFGIALAVALACAACNPMTLKQGYCRGDSDCPGSSCDMTTWKCVVTDGGMESVDVRDGGDAEVPFNCNKSGCSADAGVCNPDGGMCVECLTDDTCSAKNINAPKCDMQVCRACQKDDECPDPMICLPDGHCAKSIEVIYVEFTSTCPNSTGAGTSANPYCTPNEAVAALDAVMKKQVIVIRGPTADRMTLGTVGIAPVIIGRNGASGAASIPATAATAIQITSDQVFIRDLTITGGTAMTSRGIAATGATTVTLSNVTVNLVTDGLGIQADNGATLTTDHCTVTNNKRGGIRLDAALFHIKNTKVTNNGPGDDNGPWGGMRITNGVTNSTLDLISVTNNNNVGISCTAGIASSGVLAADNAGGLQISSSCQISPCTPDAGTACGAQF